MDTTLLKPPDHNARPYLAVAMMVAAILVNLPLLAKTDRKAARTSPPVPFRNPTGIRTIVRHTITLATRSLLILIVLSFSAALLPTWAFIGLSASAALVGAMLLHRSIQIHGPSRLLSDEANMETIKISAPLYPTGIVISDLKLTGASVIGVERNNSISTKPQPDQDLQEGDRLLLLGTPSQLKAARQLLLGSNLVE